MLTELMTNKRIVRQEVIAMRQEDNRPRAGLTETLIMETEALLKVTKAGIIIKILISVLTGIHRVISALRTEMEGRQIDSEITSRVHSWTHRAAQESRRITDAATRWARTRDPRRMRSTKRKK
jgi:hypothetical protein